MFKALKALIRRDDKIPSDLFDVVSDLRATLPRDSAGVTLFPDDTVTYRGKPYEVVAMSHRQKVVIRRHGSTSGGRWVPSRFVRLSHHHTD